MAAVLETVTQIVSAARVLLQDTVSPYRYPDADLLLALGLAFTEARRLRPDMFINTTTMPSYSAVDSTVVDIDQQYRSAFLYYVVGFAQLRDDENTQDSRAAALLNKFASQLVGVA